MAKSRYHVAKKSCFAFFLLVSLVMAGCVAKSNTVTLADGKQVLKVRGKVEIVEPDIGMLILDGRGDTTTISFTDMVAMRGFDSMVDIKKGNPLEVVYLKDNLGNYAVSIKRLPAGCCDS